MPDNRTRGLGSLLSTTQSVSPSGPQASTTPDQQSRILDIPIAAIVPNPKQHRRTFRPESLTSLAASIQEHGLFHPVVVRPIGNAFELVAGERRWRAAKLAGLDTIRAICRSVSETSSLIMSVVENLQREDLDPIEEAAAYRALVDETNSTHEQIAAYVGKDRATVSNALRLLELPASIQAKLSARTLTSGHARVLLAVTDPGQRDALAERAAAESLSVRQLEQIVYGKGGTGGIRQRADRPAHLKSLEQRIAERLGVPVQLYESRRGGRLVIRFKSNQEFMRILEGLGVPADEI